MLVPQSAIITRGQLRGLFVVDDTGVARLRWVRIGAGQGEMVNVLAGLQEGERVVVDGISGLSDGQAVEVE